MNTISNINKDVGFQEILKYFKNYNTYKIEKIHNVYNILKNFNFENDIILIFNKILKELTEGNNIHLINTDEVYLSKIYGYLNILKNVKGFKKIDKQYLEIEINYWKYNLINKEKYEELIKLKKDIDNINADDNSNVYLYLWGKFLNPRKERLIIRKSEYYCDYMLDDISKIRKINKDIIDSYVSSVLSNNKLKVIKETFNMDFTMPELFFILLNNVI